MGRRRKQQQQLISTKRRKENRPSPQARNLARLLQRLDEQPDADLVVAVLQTAVQQAVAPGKTCERVLQSLKKYAVVVKFSNSSSSSRQKNSSSSVELVDLAVTVERALQQKRRSKSNKHNNNAKSSRQQQQQQQRQKAPLLSKRRYGYRHGYSVFYAEFVKQLNDDSEEEGSGSSSSDTARQRQRRRQLAGMAWKQLDEASKARYQDQAEKNGGINEEIMKQSPLPMTVLATLDDNESTKQQASVLVSDSEGVVTLEQQQQQQHEEDDDSTSSSSSSSSDLDSELACMDYWGHLMEAVHLQVVARTTTASTTCLPPSTTSRSLGLMLTYQVYRLAGAVVGRPGIISDMDMVRNKIQNEFLSVYDGSPNNMKKHLRHSERFADCRVYAVLQQQQQQQQLDDDDDDDDGTAAALWIQINIGRLAATTATGKAKKPKAGTEFVAVMVPGSNLVALAATASRMTASQCRLTPFVLSALECALTGNTTTATNASCSSPADASLQLLDGLVGTEPHELLRSARAAQAGDAIGRFARYAAIGKCYDPITEMETAATSTHSLYKRDGGESQEQQQQRLVVGAKHGRELAHLAQQVSNGSNATSALVAANSAGDVIVDHSSKEKRGRKRGRDADLGRAQDCPRRDRLRWEWKGETSAASACWLQDGDSSTADLPTHKFKCRVVMQGSDVFAGMRALIDAGLMKTPLPDYVRDAPGLGGTIVVNNGVIRKDQK